MRRLSNLPIRWRLTLLYGGILSLILVVFASGVYYYFENSLQASIDAKIKSMEVDILIFDRCEGSSLFGNFERISKTCWTKQKVNSSRLSIAPEGLAPGLNDFEAQSLSSSSAPWSGPTPARQSTKPLDEGEAKASDGHDTDHG